MCSRIRVAGLQCLEDNNDDYNEEYDLSESRMNGKTFSYYESAFSKLLYHDTACGGWVLTDVPPYRRQGKTCDYKALYKTQVAVDPPLGVKKWDNVRCPNEPETACSGTFSVTCVESAVSDSDEVNSCAGCGVKCREEAGVVGTIIFWLLVCAWPCCGGCNFCYAHSQRTKMLADARVGHVAPPPSGCWRYCCPACAVYYWEGCSSNYWIAYCIFPWFACCCWEPGFPKDNGEIIGQAVGVGQAWGDPNHRPVTMGTPVQATSMGHVVQGAPQQGLVVQAQVVKAVPVNETNDTNQR